MTQNKNHKLTLFDNCFIGNYCLLKKQDLSNPTTINDFAKKWNNLMIQLEAHIADFEDEYESIIEPIAFLEYIWLGKLIKDMPSEKIDKINSFIPSKSSLLHEIFRKRYSKRIIHSFDRRMMSSIKNLTKFFHNELIRLNLVKRTKKILNDFKCHLFVKNIEEDMRQFMAAIQLHPQQQIKMISWYLTMNLLFRRDWMLGEININMAKRLIRYYVDLREKHNLAGVALLARYLGQSSFHPERELLDPTLFEYACTGYLNSAGIRVPIMILTTEKKKLEDRIKVTVEAIKIINGELKEKKIEFVPGRIVYVDRDNPLDMKVYEIKNYI